MSFLCLLVQIASVIDNYAATLQKRADRDGFFLATQGVVQLVQRYRNGIRGHMKSVVQDLLRQYLRVELQFQQGDILHHWCTEWVCVCVEGEYIAKMLLCSVHWNT